MSLSGINRVSERKCRRTHKNSRDGCPNCKAKRIKCSEELPSCRNCIKKNYRCGYLDFPKEKLEHILKKNEKKLGRNQQEKENTTKSNDETIGNTESLIYPVRAYDSSNIDRKSFFSNSENKLSPDLFQSPAGNLTPGPTSSAQVKREIDENEAVGVKHGIQEFNGNSILPLSYPKENIVQIGSEIPNDYANSHSNQLRPYGLSEPNNSSGTIPAKYDLPLSDFLPSSSVDSLSVNTGSNSSSSTNTSEIPKDIFAMLSPITHNMIEPEFFTTKEDLRAALYKDSFHKLTHYENTLPEMESSTSTMNAYHIPNLSDNENDADFDIASDGSFENAQKRFDRHVRSTMNSADVGSVTVSESNDNNREFKNTTSRSNGITYEQSSSASLGGQSNTYQGHDYIEQSQDEYHGSPDGTSIEARHSFLPIHYHNNIFNPYSPPSNVKRGPRLHNAIIKPSMFPKLVKTERLQNLFLKNYLSHYTEGFKQLQNTQYMHLYSPVWRYEQGDEFWRSVYNQSVLIEVYFYFFMDRSISVLLRKCNHILAVDDSRKGNPNFNSGDSPHMNSVWTSFTKKDLEILTKKSYSYYGTLIRNLRESMTQIHIEFPTKISLFASWTSFIHLHASVDTFSLMVNGTTSLVKKIVHDAPTFDQIPPTVVVMINLFNDHAVASLIPDYKFDIIEKLHGDFIDFKYFIIQHQELASTTNELLLRDFINFDSFLKTLIQDVYPLILKINNYYKNVNNVVDPSDNIYYTSPTLFFNLLASWLNIIPSESLTVSSKMSPVKKMLYLFYFAVGKALSNVFTPLRTLLLTDPVSIIYPRVDFDFETYKILLSDVNSDVRQFHYFNELSKKLLRIVSFFNNRTELLAHSFASKSMLQETNQATYIQGVESSSQKIFPFTDIINLKPKKEGTGEIMITDFNLEKSITKENYPLLNTLHHEFKDRSKDHIFQLIRDQDVIQKSRVGNHEFDYNTGFFVSDYDLRETMQVYARYKKNEFSASRFDIDAVRLQIDDIEKARAEIHKMIKNH